MNNTEQIASGQPLRVLLVDDHEIYLDGLQMMLQKQQDIEVVGLALNGRECLNLTEKCKPDVILTDIVMPVMDGIAATKNLKKLYPDVHVVALTMFEQDNLIVDMLEAGAQGYLLKNAIKSEILEAIQSVNRNIPYYCRSTTTRLAKMIGQSRFNPFPSSQETNFSEREKEIIRMICQEKTSKDIADMLYLSSRTVEGYRIKILEKMQVKTVIGMVIYAIKNDLYQIGKKDG